MAELIYTKISDIMDEVEAISKKNKNSQQGYMFRGIDDIYNALHPLFKKHRVFIIPRILETKREERNTSKGGVLIYTLAKCEFTFYTTDGSKLVSIMEGEAMDSGDKSTNKAMSAALKYTLMQTFLIPTDGDNDPDGTTHKPEANVEQWMDDKTFKEIKDDINNAKSQADLVKINAVIQEWKTLPKGTRKTYSDIINQLGKAKQLTLKKKTNSKSQQTTIDIP